MEDLGVFHDHSDFHADRRTRVCVTDAVAGSDQLARVWSLTLQAPGKPPALMGDPLLLSLHDRGSLQERRPLPLPRPGEPISPGQASAMVVATTCMTGFGVHCATESSRAIHSPVLRSSAYTSSQPSPQMPHDPWKQPKPAEPSYVSRLAISTGVLGVESDHVSQILAPQVTHPDPRADFQTLRRHAIPPGRE